MKSCGLSKDHQGDSGVVQSPSGDAQMFGRKGMMPHVLCAGEFRVKHGFSPHLAPAPPGAGRDCRQQYIKGKMTGLWLKILWLLGWKSGSLLKVTP